MKNTEASKAMVAIIESAERIYNREEVVKGFVSEEHIELVTDLLLLKFLTNEGLSSIWHEVETYFRNQYAVIENDKVIAWKPFTEEVEKARDTQSAWLEIINVEARRRKAEGTL